MSMEQEWRDDLERTGYRFGAFWFTIRESKHNYLIEEERFYRDVKRSTKQQAAMDAAILAMEKYSERDKTRCMSNIIPFDLERKSMSQALVNQTQNRSIQAEQRQVDFSMMEKVLLTGDLSKMDPRDRITYYMRTCESLGLNPMSKPFDLITLNGKMVLYPNRSGTDQLRKIGNVDITIVKQNFDKETGCYEVTAQAKLPNGRRDEDMGIVPCNGLKGDMMANAKLKAVTKAKRRVTLSIMGLGWIDESEVSSVKGAKTFKMDLDTGAVVDSPIPGAQMPQDEPKQEQAPYQPPMQPQSNAGAPECCGKTMMVSKFPDKATGLIPFYCTTCKSKILPTTSNEIEIPQENFDNYQFVK